MSEEINSGVKMLCDKLVEHSSVIMGPPEGDWRAHRWMRLAEYVLENDDGMFTREEVHAVREALLKARRKEFEAAILDHIAWETDPRNDNSYDIPRVPLTKKQAKEKATITDAQKVNTMTLKTAEAMLATQYNNQAYGNMGLGTIGVTTRSHT